MKVLLLLISFFVFSCGTETGNPLTSLTSGDNNNSDPNAGNDSGELQSTKSFLIAKAVCEKIKSCYPLAADDLNCEEDILGLEGFDENLGLAADSYYDLAALMTAESDDRLTVDSNANTQCLTDLENLSCSDSEVLNAYDSSNSTDYSNFALMLPQTSGSCSDVLEEN